MGIDNINVEIKGGSHKNESVIEARNNERNMFIVTPFMPQT